MSTFFTVTRSARAILEGMEIVVSDLHDRRPMRRIPFEGVMTIGRDTGCSIVVDDPGLRPVQARIRIDGDSIAIENVGLAVRTFVDDSPVSRWRRVKIAPSSVVRIGDCVLRFETQVPAERRAIRPVPLVALPGSVEASFLDALRARPDDLASRLVYADWLEEAGRLPMAAIVRHAAGAATLDAELRSGASWLDPAWRALVWCGPIEGCPSVAARGERASCPQRWEALPLGDEPRVRACARCSKDVKLIDHLEDVEELVVGMWPPHVLGPMLDPDVVTAHIQQRRQRMSMIQRGRPARVDGVPRLAEVEINVVWCAGSHASGIVDADPGARRAAAEAWAQAAREEHASIAAFSGLSLQLLALGAPPALLEACHAAALDEIRHAQRSFEIASSFAGRPLAPSPFAGAARVGGPTTPRELARDTLLDGCINEAAAAREARSAARAAAPWLAPILAGVAADEERHAQLAWDIVAWCARVAGPELLDELARALATVPAPPLPDTADDPVLLACGIVGDRGRALAYAEALARAATQLAALAGGIGASASAE
jgi:uncharacterized protein (TIGR02996 family)